MTQFQVQKNKLTEHRVVESSTADLSEGEVLLKVDSFSFTANNITYGVMGEELRYWQFFPAADNASKDWGIIPVWGFADVVTSNAEGIEVGERLFGYFPPAKQLVIKPVNVSDLRLIDGSAHRADLPPGYNMYRRVKNEPGYNPAMDSARMLLFPLHITSFCLWDRLKDNNWFSAEQVLVLSASSKTSIGLAYALNDDAEAPTSIGITSKRNQSLVNSLSLYDQSLTYDQLEELDASKPTAIVDMSGNGEVLAKLYAHFGDNMKHCINVGLTHWDEDHSQPDPERQRSEFFFAPGHIQKRIADWGPKVFEEKSIGFMMSAAKRSLSWLEVKTLDGLTGLDSVYQDVCDGKIAPEQGLIIKL